MVEMTSDVVMLPPELVLVASFPPLTVRVRAVPARVSLKLTDDALGLATEVIVLGEIVV